MAMSTAEPHLAAIPETLPMSDLPGSAWASPRSTSDSPARGSAPISPTSRLLRPTLSWQAKASWIPEPPAASGTTPTGIDSHGGCDQGQEPIAAVRAKDQATAGASQLSPSPPSAGWLSTQNPVQSSQGDTGQSSINIPNTQVTYVSMCIVACASCRFTSQHLGAEQPLHGCASVTQCAQCVAGDAQNMTSSIAQAQQPSHGLVCFMHVLKCM